MCKRYWWRVFGGCVGVRKLRTHCALAGPLPVYLFSVCECVCDVRLAFVAGVCPNVSLTVDRPPVPSKTGATVVLVMWLICVSVSVGTVSKP